MSIFINSKNSIVEVLKTNHKIIKAFVIKDTNHALVKDLNKRNVTIEYLDKLTFSKKFKDAHQGISLEITDYQYYPLEKALKERKENPLYLMLDGISDPHNFGAILRSCDASGVDLVIIPRDRSVSLNETVAKVSTGAIEHVKVAQVTNLNQTIKKLKDEGFWICGTDASGTINYYDLDCNMPICLVIGSEGEGMHELVKKNCDFILSIPMVGHVNSLNASVSTGILLFDIMRKRS